MKKLMRFLKDENGVTSVEYAVMIAVIAALVIVGGTFLGNSVNNKFTSTAGTITGAGS